MCKRHDAEDEKTDLSLERQTGCLVMGRDVRMNYTDAWKGDDFGRKETWLEWLPYVTSKNASVLSVMMRRFCSNHVGVE